jgi:DNA-binding transcriptional MocR family regulator
MTIWRPERLSSSGHRYIAIVQALEGDIASGRLRHGDRLPPQRELADALKVTLTTVTRAYSEAAKRGLVEGEVGRGTFVRAAVEEGGDSDALIDLSINALLPHAHAAELAGRLAPSGKLSERVRLLDYHPPLGIAEHRAAARKWLADRGLQTADAEVAVTAGAQHGLLVVMMALLPRGGDVLVEDLTYSGFKDLAVNLRLNLHSVAMDVEGLRPADLDGACRRTSARVLYTMPALHNPSGISMPIDRQQEIAAIARRHDLTVVEDDTYGFLVPDVPPLAALIPERTITVTSVSKSVTGGLRIGYVAVPPRWREPLAAAVWNTVLMVSPITAEIATTLIEDGTAARIVAWKREETMARQRLARLRLPGISDRTHPASPHVWLPLERPWRAETFAASARARGVLVTPGTAFAVREGAFPRAVRVALGPPRSRERLERGLLRLFELQQERPAASAVL